MSFQWHRQVLFLMWILPATVLAQGQCPWGETAGGSVFSPLDPRAVQRLMGQAEAAYRDRRDTDSIALLRQVLGRDPLNERAWLRMGNLMQRTGRPDAALAAYSRASAVDPTEEAPQRADRPSRTKASLNFALLAMQRAHQVLGRIDLEGLDNESSAVHAELLARLGPPVPIELPAQQSAARHGSAKVSSRNGILPKAVAPNERKIQAAGSRGEPIANGPVLQSAGGLPIGSRSGPTQGIELE